MTLKGPSEPRYKFRAESEPDMFRYVARVLAMEAINALQRLRGMPLCYGRSVMTVKFGLSPTG